MMKLIEIEANASAFEYKHLSTIEQAAHVFVNIMWEDPFQFDKIETVIYPPRLDLMQQKILVTGLATKGQQIVSEEYIVPSPLYPFVGLKYCAAERHDEMFQRFMKYFSDLALW